MGTSRSNKAWSKSHFILACLLTWSSVLEVLRVSLLTPSEHENPVTPNTKTPHPRAPSTGTLNLKKPNTNTHNPRACNTSTPSFGTLNL